MFAGDRIKFGCKAEKSLYCGGLFGSVSWSASEQSACNDVYHSHHHNFCNIFNIFMFSTMFNYCILCLATRALSVTMCVNLSAYVLSVFQFVSLSVVVVVVVVTQLVVWLLLGLVVWVVQVSGVADVKYYAPWAILTTEIICN